MIRELEQHITQEQLDAITEIIIAQYRRYRNWANAPMHQNLFINEYRAHRRQNDVSWAIVSGFPTGAEDVPDLQIRAYKSDGGHTRPMLQNQRIIIHILNHTSNFQAQYLARFYQFNQNNFGAEQLYCYIRFWENNNTLTRVSLCLPDETGNIFAEEVLLEENAIIQMVQAG